MRVEFNGTIYEFPDDATQQEIAQALGKLSPQAQPAPAQAQPQKRGIGSEIVRQLGLTGRAVYEAFTSPATTVLEGISGAYNLGAKALGSESRMPSFAQAQSQMLTERAGLPVPETATERAVQSGVQAMTSTAGLAKALPKVPTLAADLQRQIPAAAAAGLTAQPTAEVVKEVTGSDLAAAIAGIGVGAIAAGATGKTINSIEQGKTPLYTIKEIKERATQSYNVMDQAGVTLNPKSVSKMIGDVRTALDDARMVEGTPQATELNTRLGKLQTMIEDGSPLTFNKLDKMRSIVNDLRTSKDPDVKRLANVAITKMDNYISNLSGKDVIAGREGIDKAVAAVTSARKDWRNASRATILEDALDVAAAKALDPKASESELIRRGFINIASNKDKMNLFSKSEQNVIRSIAKGGPLDSLLTFAAQFSPLRSKLAAAGYGYGATQNPYIAGAVGGTGLAADVIQGALRRRAAQQGVKQIASGATQLPPENLASRGLLTGSLDVPLGP